MLPILNKEKEIQNTGISNRKSKEKKLPTEIKKKVLNILPTGSFS